MEEVPLIKALHDKYSKDAVVLGISTDINVERVDQTVKAKGMTWPILADGKGFEGPNPKAYRIDGTPTLFVLDRNGAMLAKPSSAKQIEASLQEALARTSTGR